MKKGGALNGTEKHRYQFFVLWGIVLFLLVTLVGLIMLTLPKREERSVPVVPVPVSLLKPWRGTLEKQLSLNGYVESRTVVTVLPKISGTLISLNVEMGAEVKEGAVLGRIDPAAYDLNLAQAVATLKGAESTFLRVKGLFAKGGTTQQVFDEAQAAYQAALAQQELAQLNRDYTVVRSPFGGRVLETHAVRGALVSPQVPLVTIADLDDLVVKAQVPEIHYASFLRGWNSLEAEIFVPALGGERYPLKLFALAPYVKTLSKSFQVEGAVSGTGELRPGMFVTVSFLLERREGAALPFTALASQNRLWYVNGRQRAQYHQVVPDFNDGRYFLVPEPLENLRFIGEGQHFLVPGQPVEILEEREVLPP